MKGTENQRSKVLSLDPKHADCIDVTGQSAEGNDEDVDITKEDLDAAQTLLKLHRDGAFTLRRLVNKHDGEIGRAVTSLLHYAIQHPLESSNIAREVEQNKRDRSGKDDLSAALTLVKLSGQSRTTSKAALALICLHQECIVILLRERQNRVPLAQLAIDKRNAAEQFLALKKFREQYPAVLRTSRREAGRPLEYRCLLIFSGIVYRFGWYLLAWERAVESKERHRFLETRAARPFYRSRPAEKSNFALALVPATSTQSHCDPIFDFLHLSQTIIHYKPHARNTINVSFATSIDRGVETARQKKTLVEDCTFLTPDGQQLLDGKAQQKHCSREFTLRPQIRPCNIPTGLDSILSEISIHGLAFHWVGLDNVASSGKMEKEALLSNLHERRFPKDHARTGEIHRRPAPVQTDIAQRCSAVKAHPTQPETPLSMESAKSQNASRALFHNYLRAFCQFEPPAHLDKNDKALRMTVRLDAGDLILIHSVHANGWADGTVLSTGARGWLPTNYCETFDHPSMRHLLNAMTQFWDLLGAGEDANLSTFVRQDYVRPLIAGVRHLLEHADCLHRDAALIQRSAGLRRLRKGLLADLSTLVQIAKRLQDVISEPYAGEVVPLLLDDLMARAFKVVTRAVGFVDMLAQEKTFDKPTNVSDESEGDPKISNTDNTAGADNAETHPVDPQPVDSAKHFPNTSPTSDPSTKTAAAANTRDEVNGGHESRASVAKPSKGLITHRLSMVKTDNPQSRTLASEQLAQAHDMCISHIGSFIGLYLHSSRPASELASTTERLVSACETMLVIVDKVSSCVPLRLNTVQRTQASFRLKLDELTKSTKDILIDSRHGDDDVVMLPEQTNRLIEVGTSLIRTVGDCVVKTRKVIEQVGDFDLENPPIREDDFDSEEQSAISAIVTESRVNNPESGLVPSVKGRVPVAMQPPNSTSRQRAMTATDIHDFGGERPFLESDVMLPKIPISQPSHRSMPLPARSEPGLTPTSAKNNESAKPTEAGPNESTNSDRQCSVGASISGSTDTNQNSLRDSGFTAVSEGSTRATTPDQGKDPSLDVKVTTSFGSLASLRSAANTEESHDAEAQLLQKSFANELTLNKDGQVTGGSLSALVEQLTVGDVAPDPQFVAAFFVTFRSFTTPRELAQALIYRFDYIGDSKGVGVPVRLRIYNVFKGWLETYWNAEADRPALGDIRYFALHKLKPNLGTAGERLVDLTRRIGGLYHAGTMAGPLVSGVGKTATSIGAQDEGETNAPEPVITKSQLNALRQAVAGAAASCTIVDFDPLELARQMTILASNIFCEIQTEELLSLEWNKKDSTKAQNVRNMCILNTDVAHVVGDTILAPEDAKKRALVIKHWSKVATRCLELNNYESLMAIMCSLNSSVVQRLKRTWEIISKKTRARLAELNTVVDFSRNQASLRRRLEKPITPCLPFLGIYLTDLTMVDAGNPKLRELPGTTSESGETLSVINFDKHLRMAKIVSHVQKFQVRYKLKELPEMQDWMHMHLERMREGHAGMVGTFHRRSLYIEPKGEPSNVPVPRLPQGIRATEPNVPEHSAAEERPKTAGSMHPTIKSIKPHGPTFEFLLKTNFNFKSRPHIARSPDDMGQE